MNTNKMVKYQGDCIVSTVSVGVLKSSDIIFQPNLPIWKLDAINQYGMCVFCKIFVEFPEIFWDKTKNIYHVYYIKNAKKDYYPVFRPVLDSNVMIAIVFGEEARRIERQSDDDTISEIYEVIRNSFGKSCGNDDESLKKFRPKKIHVCRWDTDPRFYGSYSIHKIKAFEKQDGSLRDFNQALKSPENGVKKVYFAGEAHSDRYNGYMNGAYTSGQVTAEEIIADFEN